MAQKLSTPQLIEELTLLEEEAMRFAGRCRSAKEKLLRHVRTASTPARGRHLSQAERDQLRIGIRKNISVRSMKKSSG